MNPEAISRARALRGHGTTPASARQGVVLPGAMGARYSLPTVVGALRRRGVRTARFMKSLAPWGLPRLNLRTHRKILVADGRVGFVDGIARLALPYL